MSLFFEQLQFAYPYVFILLPLFFLFRFLAPIKTNKVTEINANLLPFGLAQLAQANPQKKWFFSLLPLFLWAIFVLALARPQYIDTAIALPKEGRDLMLAIDISGSMEEPDMMVNHQMASRFDAVKAVAREFIAKRQGDKIGLILFAEKAYLQAPLTFDTRTVQQFMDESFLGLVGSRATAIGDAIGLTLKKLEEAHNQATQKKQDTKTDLSEQARLANLQASVKEKVLILLTDGNNNAGIDPMKATELAAEAGLKIYTIGIGALPGMGTRDIFGRSSQSDLDEPLLKEIAAKTHGQYYRASNVAELEQVYSKLDQLEAIKDDQQYYRPIKELFYYPLLLALLLLLVQLGISRRNNEPSY